MWIKFKRSTTPEEEDKPLLKLMKKLIILADNKQKMVIIDTQLIDAQLTNALLLSILSKDLNLNIPFHPYEVNVFIYFLKTFLKEWPYWDQVARAARYDIDSILFRKYEDFKEFLKSMLELSEPIRKETSAKLIYSGFRLTFSEITTILEIFCSPEQLNMLISVNLAKQADIIFNKSI